MEYYSAMKNNELLIHRATQMHLKIIRLSEGIQEKESKGCLGSSAVERLPLAQDVILESSDRVPHWAPCMGPSSPSAYVSASLSLCLSLNK